MSLALLRTRNVPHVEPDVEVHGQTRLNAASLLGNQSTTWRTPTLARWFKPSLALTTLCKATLPTAASVASNAFRDQSAKRRGPGITTRLSYSHRRAVSARSSGCAASSAATVRTC
ncbi:MAG: hypothetical protein ABI040_08940 [Rhodoferax sp.]